MATFLTKLRSSGRLKAVWHDPDRAYKTLCSFSETERDGGKDLERAARRVSDPELRGHLERHARDEVKHADLFHTRALELANEFALTTHGDETADKPYDLSRGRPGLELDAHGFFSAGLIDELGDLEYIAMLHVAEERAAELFTVQSSLTDHDPKTKAIFEEILIDEKYHVAYTKTFLDKWRHEGREREVSNALKTARDSRLLGAWKRLGLRSAGGFGRVLLFVFYWTLVLPFGFIARLRKPATGLVTPSVELNDGQH